MQRRGFARHCGMVAWGVAADKRAVSSQPLLECAPPMRVFVAALAMFALVLAGGLRWSAADVSYDFFVMAFDAGSLRFTIWGITNLSLVPRKFTVYGGSAADPFARRLQKCGLVRTGAVCINFIGPFDGPHGEVVTIVAEANDAPTIEHRVTVR